jgi:hypothetical protein
MPYGKGINWTTSQFKKTTETKLGSTNTDLLNKLFGTSPIYTGYDHQAVVAATNAFINADQVTENTDFPNGVDLNYAGTPDISLGSFQNVGEKTGKASDPATPWTPNISSPGEVPGQTNLDPDHAQRPIMKNEPSAFNTHHVEGKDSLVNPSVTSNEIGKFEYDSTPEAVIDLGTHPGTPSKA